MSVDAESQEIDKLLR